MLCCKTCTLTLFSLIRKERSCNIVENVYLYSKKTLSTPFYEWRWCRCLRRIYRFLLRHLWTQTGSEFPCNNNISSNGFKKMSSKILWWILKKKWIFILDDEAISNFDSSFIFQSSFILDSLSPSLNWL